MNNENIHKFINYTIENGGNPNLELEARFGKYSKISSTIRQNTFFDIFNVFKTSTKAYSYINDILSSGDVKKRAEIGDPKAFVKNMFGDPLKYDKIEDYSKTYAELANKPFYLVKDAVFKPIELRNVMKIALAMENPNAADDGKPPIIQKNKFRCSCKEGSWNVDLTILFIIDLKTNKSGVFFEVELEFNHKSFVSKKQTADQAIIDFKKYSEIITSIIECDKMDNIEMEIRYSISNQVKTLGRPDLSNIVFSRYAVTDKADGERAFIYVDKKKSVYQINPNNIILDKILIARNTNIQVSNILIDGELIVIDGKPEYLGFDAIFFDGKDLRNYNLPTRLNQLKKAVVCLNKVVSKIQFKMKAFYMDNVFVNAGRVWNERAKLFKYNLDGLIFTPVRGAYMGNLANLKWKDKHSIDIRIMYNGKTNFTEFHSASGYRGKNVYVDRVTGKEYFPNRVSTNNSQYKKLGLVNSYGVLGIDGRLTTDTFLKNMVDIIEVEFDIENGKWVYLRKRDDKEKPNAYRTVLGVLDAIIDNVTIEELSKLKFVPSAYEKVGDAGCYSNGGFNLTSSITSNMCSFYTYSYKKILPKGSVVLALGCDICVLRALIECYSHVLIIEPNCLEVYGEYKSEGYTGLKEFAQQNSKTPTIVWGDSNISGGLLAFTKQGQSEINSFMKKHNKFDTVFINSFSNIVYDGKKFDKIRYDKTIKNLKLLTSNIVCVYLNATQIIKYLEKKTCIALKNRDRHPLYKVYLKPKNLIKYKQTDIFKIKNTCIKKLEIQRVQNSSIPQYQPVIFDKNIQDVLKSSNLKIKECKSFKSFYQEYKRGGGIMDEYDCIISDITKYFSICF